MKPTDTETGKEVKVPVDRSVRVIQKGASEGVAELIALLRR